MGLGFRDNGKENGNNYSTLGVPLKGAYRAHIGIMRLLGWGFMDGVYCRDTQGVCGDRGGLEFWVYYRDM